MKSKLIYIASPYAGDVKQNVAFAKRVCRHAISQGHTPIAVHLLYPQMLDDNDPSEREIGLRLGHRVLESCDEMWVCGDRISSGMAREISEAESLGIPIRSVSGLELEQAESLSVEQEAEEPAPVYTIWADARRDGPLAGQTGFLCENRKRLYFTTEAEAAQKLHDLKNLCVNKEPAVSYKCIVYPGKYASSRNMHLETIRQFDLKPDFDPQRHEIKSRVCGDTGGSCLVGTVQFYLPDLGKSVWVNCNDESVTIASADFVWNEDKSGSWERVEDVLLFSAVYQEDRPEDAGPWLPMIKEALSFTIKEETARCREGGAFWLPVDWLPDACRQTAEPEYLAWLREQGEKAGIGRDGRIIIDEAYLRDGQLGMMTQQ